MYGDNMNFKSVFKRETKVIAIVVICMVVVVMGTSYALFFQINHNNNNQVVTSGSLEVTYGNGATVTVDDTADNNCLIPQDDESGSGSGGCEFILSVTNTGTLPMDYKLMIYNDTETLASVDPTGTFVDHQYIKYTLTKQLATSSTSETVATAAILNAAPLNDQKRVLETNHIASGDTITFSLKVWIDEDAPDTIIGNYVYLKLDVTGEVYDEGETAAAALSAYMDTNGLEEIVSDTSVMAAENATTSIKEFRFSGSNPNNYIYFNCTDENDVATCEKWRILGVYNDNNESKIKLINSSYTKEDLTDISFDEGTTLYTYLNTDFYNSLSDSAKAKISSSTYYIGVVDSLDYDAKSMYGLERNFYKTVSANVGLMSVSDYAFAAGLYSNEMISSISSKNSNNWLYNNKNELLVNPYLKNSDGSVTSATSDGTKLIRPVVYLNSNVKFSSGDGTNSNPYVLAK